MDRKTLPGQRFNNVDRADRAIETLQTYIQRCDDERQNDPAEEVIGDLLTDLRHLCRMNGLDFEKKNQMSEIHHQSEIASVENGDARATEPIDKAPEMQAVLSEIIKYSTVMEAIAGISSVLARRVREVEWDNCEGCSREFPGFRPDANMPVGHAGKPPRGYTIVERCDTCNRYINDIAAARNYGSDARWQHGNNTMQAICRKPRRHRRSDKSV